MPLLSVFGSKLVGASNTLPVVTIARVQKGTMEWEECNRRGVCGTNPYLRLPLRASSRV